ncbi:hypothetical protein Sfulv_57240 [Streptomyces fulvorobeus]|uniref:Uncharacterized protein n=1 Tax=Streptomyces fulvorobeus TaxID=284028 RepID=A0A7J0CG87_9ACTN|nr:hypothetical protein Sfulv_57240 [Streptomyces fulvorobeus]
MDTAISRAPFVTLPRGDRRLKFTASSGGSGGLAWVGEPLGPEGWVQEGMPAMDLPISTRRILGAGSVTLQERLSAVYARSCDPGPHGCNGGPLGPLCPVGRERGQHTLAGAG